VLLYEFERSGFFRACGVTAGPQTAGRSRLAFSFVASGAHPRSCPFASALAAAPASSGAGLDGAPRLPAQTSADCGLVQSIHTRSPTDLIGGQQFASG